ncbi:MAG TPA: anhydro-N-acetylmuramic acid kinase, partial [Zeimonas sp.]|nr:anhydro-N-acetylmuramic acid kinase [Zeimonas sp.]
RHRPELGYTIQLLNPARLAEACGIAVVSDLRAADVAAGGQGAPLAPAFHAQVFRHATERRAVVNLGGIANVSLVPPGGPDAGAVLGFDTGPANTLLDAWCRRHTGAAFDHDGDWARGGRPDAALLETWLAEPYFGVAAPKSTGRDLFNADWLDRSLAAQPDAGDPRGVQATLVELTAVTVARACRSLHADRIVVCGGGVRNGFLMERLAVHAAPTPVASTQVLGIDPQAVEAAAFAWLAAQRVDRLPGNLPSVTGARGARVLGLLAEPRPRE